MSVRFGLRYRSWPLRTCQSLAGSANSCGEIVAQLVSQTDKEAMTMPRLSKIDMYTQEIAPTDLLGFGNSSVFSTTMRRAQTPTQRSNPTHTHTIPTLPFTPPQLPP